jgi:hypothetical protein
VPVAPPAACTRRTVRTSLPTALAASPESVGWATFAGITVVSALRVRNGCWGRWIGRGICHP